MRPLTIRNDWSDAEAPRDRAGGIWRDRRAATSALAHTTRAALGERRPGEDLAVALDDEILEQWTHAAGWDIPIRTRSGAPLFVVRVSVRVPDLIDDSEVTLGWHWDIPIPRPIAVRARMERAIIEAINLPAAITAYRDLVKTLTRESDRKAVVTAVVTGHKKGRVAKAVPLQPGQSLALFGAENRT